MATFSKVTFTSENTNDSYGEHEAEAVRIEDDFTVNTSKNVHKNYRKKIYCCSDGQFITISPNDCPTPYLTIQPDSETCPDLPRGFGHGIVHVCHDYFTVDPGIGEPEDYLCASIPPVEQVPFVLATRGVVFRQRGVPHFTSIGKAEVYTN
jgi:hypothetical protein